jgi:hypothetical protein
MGTVVTDAVPYFNKVTIKSQVKIKYICVYCSMKKQRCGFEFNLGGPGSRIFKEFWIGRDPDFVAQKETFLLTL